IQQWQNAAEAAALAISERNERNLTRALNQARTSFRQIRHLLASPQHHIPEQTREQLIRTATFWNQRIVPQLHAWQQEIAGQIPQARKNSQAKRKIDKFYRPSSSEKNVGHRVSIQRT
ncbi:MAG: hypothetical protein D6820_07320, partial [Lentisphaerae bacterium]